MKYIIDTDIYDETGAKAVDAFIKNVQRLYPKATYEDIVWGMIHMTAVGCDDLFMHAYLPNLAKANRWKRKSQF